jgi:hypothetical protein
LPRRSGGHHHNFSSAAEGIPLSAFSFQGASKMKVLTVFFAIVVLFTLAACGNDFDAEAEQEKLEATLDEFYGPTATTDIATANEIMHPEYTAYFGNRDFQGILTRYEVMSMDAADMEVEIHERKWMIEPDLAVVRSHETWQFPGEPWECLLTMVLAKNDGEWQIIHTHVSDFH